MRKCVYALALAAMLWTGPAVGQELSSEVQADLEQAKIEQDMRAAARAVADKRYADALKEFDKLHEAGVPFPPSASLAEARAAAALKRWSRAEEALQRIFDTADRESDAYKEALALYLEIQEAKAADEKARAAAAAAARKKAEEEQQAAEAERLRLEAEEDERQRVAEEARLAELRAEYDKQVAEVQRRLSPTIGSSVSVVIAPGANDTVRVFYSESDTRTSHSEVVFNPRGEKLTTRSYSQNIDRLKWQRGQPIGKIWMGAAVTDAQGNTVLSQMFNLKSSSRIVVVTEMVDRNGNSMWWRQHAAMSALGAPQEGVNIGALIKTRNGELIECGSKKYPKHPSHILFLIRDAASGGQKSIRTTRGEKDAWAWCNGIAEQEDGRLVAITDLDAVLTLFWLDDGKIVGSKTLGVRDGSNYLVDIEALPGNMLALAGWNGAAAVVQFMTAEGELKGVTPFSELGYNAQFRTMTRDGADSLVAAGGARQGEGNYFPFVARVSNNGTMLASKAIRSLGDNWIADDIVKVGSGYAVLIRNQTASYRGGARLLFLNSNLELAPEGGFPPRPGE